MSHPSPQKNGGSHVPPPRQIRFVSTDGQPQTKRRRVNAACRTCRKRKIRCSGEQPDLLQRPPIPQNEKFAQSPEAPKVLDLKGLAKDSVVRTRESEQQVAGESPESNRTSLSSGGRTYVPYFRYFGPTAIVPGFKQMVVQVRGSRKSNASLSSDSMSPLRSPKCPSAGANNLNSIADTNDNWDANTIPFYDRDDSLPVSNLVTHLCDLFFVHLGCSFPFLRRERFLRDLKEKKVDTMLVDAVCALSARFSSHPLLSPPQATLIDDSEPQLDLKKSDRGQPFAHRAISALVDSLSCPTLSVVQACLLLAYEEFGSNHDSGLWMYLGISIRMAQDLGMQKLQGLEYCYGRTGVTPSAVVTGQASKLREDQYDEPLTNSSSTKESQEVEDRRAWERERVDAFWSIFFLDRVISSGTGRPVTLRDEDIELRFPLQSESRLLNGWPAPFPPLIRIIHLYGRVTDLINGIQDVNHVTPETLKRLAGMESDLTGIYQRLSPKLHFNAANFQAYVKAKEGTNFILLHFWFHTVIVLLHQPTLLNSFGGTIQHLYPNSRELSMSSAKTIADILSFSELVDGKSFIGNPFTSQPMYIAACAFLMESAYYSSPSSRSGSPPSQPLLANQTSGFVMPSMDSSNGSDRKPTAKHILLASAAKENYQRCYKALKAIETYWEGSKYILTVLDQKAKGIVDPLLYTEEEMEGAAEIPVVQPLPGPNWRQTNAPSGPTNATEGPLTGAYPSVDSRRSPRIDPSQGKISILTPPSMARRFNAIVAIGWALTNATNSSQPNLSLLYQMPATPAGPISDKSTYPSQYSHSYAHLPVQSGVGQNSGSYPREMESSGASNLGRNSSIVHGPERFSPLNAPGRVSTSDAGLLLGLNAPYPNATSRPSNSQPSYNPNILSPSSGLDTQAASYNYNMPSAGDRQVGGSHLASRPPDLHMNPPMGDMLIESQDIDMSSLQEQDQLPFAFNGEILPWLEYLPQDVLSFFAGDHQSYPPLMSHDDGAPRPPS
ncbi:hypothetical protein AOCH_006584 [Aspergillus ochraceoroseus]|uniref:Xylanolytic transcriptional activator regulatory domain-containing protein n=1 Tax=Aspergillus ochraceoroseus TaxID=138278 RepID=A0A0F8X500_9EURO|nr:hypothetical protein AOCH_006584 [Aspergillus ochraceoroseus]